MSALNSFFIIFTLMFVVLCDENLYCDSSMKSCDIDKTGVKLLFYDVNPQEGFNLKRDVYMRFAIATAEANKKLKSPWNVVLPPWYRLYHWKSVSYWSSKPVVWSLFFDLDEMNTFTPVMDLVDAFKYSRRKKLIIDRVYVLQNFDDAFENGRFVEKWKVKKECPNSLEYWGYDNITASEVVCVQFQGKASKLFEIISLHPFDEKVMFLNGEVALHDGYGDKKYWDCRKSMKFNEALMETAENFIKDNLKCSNDCKYLSVHLRRQDFARSRAKDVPSIHGAALQIYKSAVNNDIKKVFIATDASESELTNLKKELESRGLEALSFVPTEKQLNVFKDGGVAIIDQIVCSKAALFIGTYESTFTFRIQEEREIAGFDSGSTFNRLCPDDGRCDQMSKWTIVH